MKIGRRFCSIFGLVCLPLLLIFSINFIGVMEREIFIWTPTFDIYKLTHKVWGNKEMIEYIIGKKYEEFKKNASTDKLVQEVQPRKFDFIINNETLCRSTGRLEFLIVVYTAPLHRRDRNIIRKTWGRQNFLSGHTSRTLFLLGAVQSPRLQEKILTESKTYGDIAQANFIDSYHNLSWKGITELQWINTYCKNAQYLIKTDDDMYVDIFQIVKTIRALIAVPRFIIGLPNTRPPIYRNLSTKWGVEKHLMPGQTYYVPYYFGRIYILPNTVFCDLFQAAMETPVFFIDDVYITGLLASQLSNLEFLEFKGKVPKGTFMPAHPNMVRGCEADCIVALFCEHLTKLTNYDINLIGRYKSEKVIREVGCAGLLLEKRQK